MAGELDQIQWFVENGCELAQGTLGIDLFVGIYHLSHGKPCDGCNCKATCPAWPKLKQPVRTVVSGPRCPKCHSLLNMVKVARRGGKCACGEKIV